MDRVPEIVLAPMAGGPTTVALTTAVCEAGGLGFLAAGYLTAAAMVEQVHELRARTARAFGVNVFLMEERDVDHEAVAAYLETLAPVAARLGVELGAPRFHDDEYAAKVAALIELRAPVVSFTFACPARETVAALQAAGSQVWVTVTSPAEARIAAEQGVDALVAQGGEAGGHRGAFNDDGGADALDAQELTRALVDGQDLPVVAAGGVATADDVRRLRTAGAVAVQVGTAFLLADEAGTGGLHRDAVRRDLPTAFTNAFTGRTARGIVNAFMQEHAAAPFAFPHVHHATAPLRAAARRAGDADHVHLWAGTRHHLAEPRPAADIVHALQGGLR